tara:strand:+ start:1468 stop:1668 length:201 start_codon:yes stop_codon:yes gene_type:complete
MEAILDVIILIAFVVILFKTPSALALLVGWGHDPLRDAIVRIVAGAAFMTIGMGATMGLTYFLINL